MDKRMEPRKSRERGQEQRARAKVPLEHGRQLDVHMPDGQAPGARAPPHLPVLALLAASRLLGRVLRRICGTCRGLSCGISSVEMALVPDIVWVNVSCLCVHAVACVDCPGGGDLSAP